jgi:hypothetical protein
MAGNFRRLPGKVRRRQELHAGELRTVVEESRAVLPKARLF